MTRVIETDESGRLVLSPELLREMFGETAPHTRYAVDVQGEKIFISSEATTRGTETAQSKPSIEQWERQWRELAEEIGKVWPAGVSAVDAVSEQRR